MASQLTLFYKMKHEGKILLGRDIRPEIQPCFSRWERLKAIWVPQSNEVESVNLFLTGAIPQGQEKLEGFASATAFAEETVDRVCFSLERKLGLLGGEKMQFVRQAAAVKREGFRGGRGDAVQFCGPGLPHNLEHQCRGDNQVGRESLRHSRKFPKDLQQPTV